MKRIITPDKIEISDSIPEYLSARMELYRLKGLLARASKKDASVQFYYEVDDDNPESKPRLLIGRKLPDSESVIYIDPQRNSMFYPVCYSGVPQGSDTNLFRLYNRALDLVEETMPMPNPMNLRYVGRWEKWVEYYTLVETAFNRFKSEQKLMVDNFLSSIAHEDYTLIGNVGEIRRGGLVFKFRIEPLGIEAKLDIDRGATLPAVSNPEQCYAIFQQIANNVFNTNNKSDNNE